MPSNGLALDSNRPFSVSAVAAVTEVEPRIINRFIDDEVLPPGTYRRKNNERAIYSFACPIVGFYSSEAGSSLTKDTKREVADWLAERLESNWSSIFNFELHADNFMASNTAFDELIEDQLALMDITSALEPGALVFSKGAMVLNLTDSVHSALEFLFKLRLAEALMVGDPDIRGGITTIRGTRISPYEAAGMALAEGIDSAMEAYPRLSRKSFELSILYSKANPLRGRPKEKDDDWKKNWRLVSETVVPLGEFMDQGP